MAFVEYHKNNIGDTVKTSLVHENFLGYFEVGTEVKIVDADPFRGYTIEDEHGHRISEIGWVI